MANAQSNVLHQNTAQKNIFSKPELKQILSLAYQRPEPATIAVLENSPNPFHSVTTVQFSVSTKEFATVRIINPLGREICTLFSQVTVPNKMYEVVFDGIRLPSAVYFCLLQTRSERKIIRIVLLK